MAMNFIELTDAYDWNRKFNLRVDLIESISPINGNRSFIRLTTGRSAECLESPETVKRLVKTAEAESA